MSTGTATFPPRETRQFEHPWLEAMVAALDGRLRRQHGVFEFTHNPDCLFRIQVAAATDDLALSDGVRISAGDRVICLHVWNEQFPPFPPSGPTLQWARRVNHSVEASLREVAYYLNLRRELDDVRAVCGNLAFVSAERSTALARFMSRFGFERIIDASDAPSLADGLHRFGENILITMMVLARNATALHADTLWRDRLQMAISRQKLQQRYDSERVREP